MMMFKIWIYLFNQTVKYDLVHLDGPHTTKDILREALNGLQKDQEKEQE